MDCAREVCHLIRRINMTANESRVGIVAFLLVLSLAIPATGQESGLTQPESLPPSGLVVQTDGPDTTLSLGAGGPFHRTANEVTGQRLIEVADSSVRLVLWEEVLPDGRVAPFYAISLDGQTMATVRRTSYVLKVRHGDFDPDATVPPVAAPLAADATTNVYIVQCVSQPLTEFRTAIEDLGGTVYHFLANHAHLVKMTPQVRDAVAALPYVRWVGPYHPAYRLETFLRENRQQADELFGQQRYNIMVFEPGFDQKNVVADRIKTLGGQINTPHAGKYLLEATLTPEQLFEVIRWDEVLFVDRWSPYEKDMDIVREIGGADYIETVAGYTGAGVRGEAFDAGCNVSHPDFASRPLILHGSVGVDAHGTATAGVCFGDGTGDPQARGLMPDGQGIVADYSYIGMTGTSRYDHTGELLEDPYYAVFQTASVGSSQTPEYTSVSADTDAALFDFDIVHCQSQSNMGSQYSRPQAWAKNIIAGGAVYHYDTLTRDDDCWCYGASIGPAADGRIKPDLCFFYDYTWTTYSSGSGYGEFGGTSGATPSICGYVGLFHQMWSDGIFGNEVYPPGGGPSGYDVFDNRPHMATAKAFMINTASPYPFTGTSHDLTRVHQGWGLPDVQYLYDMRDNISFIDETELLASMESVEYAAYVDPGEPAMRVTLVYADPPGVPSSSQHRINDLTLKVTSPSETVYWGNHGLLEGNWSAPGGTANMVDTVENVFIQDPESGVWTVEVIASEVNQDSHVESPELDADFALVVSGAFLATCTSDGRIVLNKAKYPCSGEAVIRVIDCDLNTDDELIETVEVTIASTTEPEEETVLLTETAAETADFRGPIPLSTTDAEGVLQVSHGDTITATYNDEDDGTGNPAVVQDTALVDCIAPQIFNVQTIDIEPRSAKVTFDTDEPATAAVRYGLSCESLSETAIAAGYATDHTVNLSSLDDNTTYFYAVDAEDEAGNLTTDDNGGLCYSFSTPEIPDFFTELFGNNDLDGLSLIFIPNESTDFYIGCVEEITELPTDPADGTVLTMSSADTYATVTLTGEATVWLYGVGYGTFYVGSNGYITFNSGDSEYSESLEEHFEQPRISALFDDLNPSSSGGGSVSWKQLSDRVAVTWENVPEYTATGSNTFQIEMYFDGTIVLSYSGLTAGDGLTGLSEGNGLSPDYYTTDLSVMGPCAALTIELPDGVPWRVDPEVPTTITVQIEDGGETVVPGSETLYYRFDGGTFLTSPLAPLGGNLYEATLPAADCDSTPEFYFSAAGDGGTTIYEPPDAPVSVYSAIVATLTVILDDDFETDQGWTVEDIDVETGSWERGIPAGDGTRGDPLTDFDGSGQCYLTGNAPGNSDVDGGPTRLISPILDLSGASDTVLRYARWFTCDDDLPPAQDYLDVEVSNDDGASWTLIESVAHTEGWVERTIQIADYVSLTSQVRVRFSVADNPNNSKTEVGIDALEVLHLACAPGVTGDFDEDGDVDLDDFARFVDCLAGPGATPDPPDPFSAEDCLTAFDFDGDLDVDLQNFAGFQEVFGGSQ